MNLFSDPCENVFVERGRAALPLGPERLEVEAVALADGGLVRFEDGRDHARQIRRS